MLLGLLGGSGARYVLELHVRTLKMSTLIKYVSRIILYIVRFKLNPVQNRKSALTKSGQINAWTFSADCSWAFQTVDIRGYPTAWLCLTYKGLFLSVFHVSCLVWACRESRTATMDANCWSAASASLSRCEVRGPLLCFHAGHTVCI